MFSIKKSFITFFLTTFICVISLAENNKDIERQTPLILSRALVDSEFSPIESTPIIKAFFNWINVTNGDIIILPPEEEDVDFFENALSGNITDANLIMSDFRIKVTDIWSPLCNQTFYVIRINSKNSTIKEIEKVRGGKTLAITFHGCLYKFIAIVSDRIESEKMMYDVVSHELGHMWGLEDNNKGENSIMSGHYPVSTCITKDDLKEFYNLHQVKIDSSKIGGCVK